MTNEEAKKILEDRAKAWDTKILEGKCAVETCPAPATRYLSTCGIPGAQDHYYCERHCEGLSRIGGGASWESTPA